MRYKCSAVLFELFTPIHFLGKPTSCVAAASISQLCLTNCLQAPIEKDERTFKSMSISSKRPKYLVPYLRQSLCVLDMGVVHGFQLNANRLENIYF
ncbi:hypothetical protein CEXT_423811 [Caerostris extrusa]|uniref:Uncharacterized protein n=1 Tax=Caerostris extrusa TaxID=172846 RepID=A0AAV4Q3J0_CAEEX|nr:hypothetical protein CEXT_423811 [Caerostris extrusa]